MHWSIILSIKKHHVCALMFNALHLEQVYNSDFQSLKK